MRKLNAEEVSALGGAKLRYKEAEEPTPDMPSAIDNSTNQSRKSATPFGEMQQMQNPPPGDSWFDKFKDGTVTNMHRAFEFTKGMAKSVTALPTEAAEFGKDISDKFGETAVGQKLSQAIGNNVKGFVSPETAESLKKGQEASTEGSFVTETSNDDQAAGKIAGEVAQAFVPVGGQARAASLGGKLAKALNVGEKGTKLISGVARVGGEVLENALQTGIQSGDLEQAKDAGFASGVIAGASKPLGILLNKTGNAVFSGVIPATIKERAKDIKRMFDMGETASQTGISFSRNSVMKKLQQVAGNLEERMQGHIDEFIAKNPGDATSIDDLASHAESLLTDKSLMKDMHLTTLGVKQAKQAVGETINEYKKLFEGKKMSVQDVQEFKRSFNSALESEFKKAELAVNKASKYAEIKLRSAAQKFVEDKIPQAKEINKKFAPVLEALGRLEAKGEYSGLLGDIIAGSAGASGGPSFFEDPASYIKNAVVAVAIKRGANSTLAKTFGGTILKDLSKIIQSPQFYKAAGNIYARLHNDVNKKED